MVEVVGDAEDEGDDSPASPATAWDASAAPQLLRTEPCIADEEPTVLEEEEEDEAINVVSDNEVYNSTDAASDDEVTADS
jgi:hypothetical protein